MTIMVEAFFDEEIATVNQEEKELMIEMAQKLGYDNQVEQLQNPVLNSYRYITAEEIFVYGINFPNLMEVRLYTLPIPLRVLQIISHFLEIFPGYHIKVMCPEPGKKDPVVVASRYSWNQLDGDYYILCRFGEALEEFNVLRKKAMQVLEERFNFKNLNYTNLNALWQMVNGK